jgi:hypothetical protein
MDFWGTEQVARMRCKRNAYRILVENLLAKSPLKKVRRRREDNIRVYFTRTDCEGARWMGLTRVRVQGQTLMLAMLNFWVLLLQRLFVLYVPLSELGHTFIEQNFNKCTVHAIAFPLSTIWFVTFPSFWFPFSLFLGLAVKTELSQWSHYNIIDFSSNNRRKEKWMERFREAKNSLSVLTHIVYILSPPPLLRFSSSGVWNTSIFYCTLLYSHWTKNPYRKIFSPPLLMQYFFLIQHNGSAIFRIMATPSGYCWLLYTVLIRVLMPLKYFFQFACLNICLV